MSLSRHFYALDEVQSALHDCTTRNNVQETLFWCYELIQSGCASEAISTLFDSWIWQKGAFHLSWLLHAWSTMSGSELSETDIMVSAYQHSWIPYHKRDNSVLNLLLLGSSTPERVTYKTPPTLPPSVSELELYFLRAAYQGKGHCAWWSARQLEHGRLWELISWYIDTYGGDHTSSLQKCIHILQHYENLLGYHSDEYDMIMRCIAVCMCCLNNEQLTNSLAILPVKLPDNISTMIHEWDMETSTKKRRKYSIPQTALYGRTQRGHMKWSQSTIPFLHAMEDHLQGCPFWDDVLVEYGEYNNNRFDWKSHESKVLFYERYLPDDHPDEWTKPEKSKSHGDGIMGPRDSFMIQKYARLYFSKRSRLAWTMNKKIQELLESVKGEHPNDLLTHILKLNNLPVCISENQFQPVHRMVQV